MFRISAALAFIFLSVGVSSTPALPAGKLPRPEAAAKLDPEVTPALTSWPFPAVLTKEILPALNKQINLQYNAETATKGHGMSHRDFNFTSSDGHGSTLSVFIPDSVKDIRSRPFIYYIHGGGLVYGNRFFSIDFAWPLIRATGAVFISVEYRLAPDHPAPAAAEDVYAGLVWTIKNADLLGIDPSNGIVWGSSAGGGLAAVLGLMVRDRAPAGVDLKGLLLHYPMLDNTIPREERDLFRGTSSPIWSSESDEMAWKAYLGSSRANERNPYLVPARATDLSNLPRIYIEVGSAELFRKPVLAYAQRIWEAGGLVELHVAAGAIHASDLLVPTAKVSIRANDARKAWAVDVLNGTS